MYKKVMTIDDNSKQYNKDRDYGQNVYLFGGQWEGQTQVSAPEETEQQALEWSHMMVVVIGFGDYKPEEVVEEKLTVEQGLRVKKTQ